MLRVVILLTSSCLEMMLVSLTVSTLSPLCVRLSCWFWFTSDFLLGSVTASMCRLNEIVKVK